MTGKIHRDCVKSCHKPHNTKGKDGPLLKKERLNDACLKCHDTGDPTAFGGNAKQVRHTKSEFSSHISDREEKGKSRYLKRFSINGRRLYLLDSCAGCHDPHLTNGEKLKTFAFDERGNPSTVRRRYIGELCYGCHAGIDAAATERFSDIGMLTGDSARSAHRLGATSESRKDLPSLKGRLFTKELDCVSCHNDPDGSSGPHFSRYPSLLKAPFGRESFDTSSPGEGNSLCYLCHDSNSIAANESFAYHNEHITGMFDLVPREPREPDRHEVLARTPLKRPTLSKERVFRGFGQPTPCATCHDPHGSAENPFLISFDRDVVKPSSFGRLDFRKTGFRSGSCNLSCHGHDHIDSEY